MKFELQIDPDCEERVLLTLRKPSPLAEEIRTLVERESDALMGYCEDEIVPLTAGEIVCIIVEDGKVYAKTMTKTFRLNHRLYQLEERLGTRFLKINQSCLANIQQIQRFDASLAGALLVIFKNGYRDYVSRRQLKTVKERMGFHR